MLTGRQNACDTFKTMPESRTVILVPMFNDWEAASLLLRDLDSALAKCASNPEVVLIDDAAGLVRWSCRKNDDQ